MGGLARRVSYTKTFQEKLKGVPTLLVDSGYFLADERHTHGDLRADAVVKNEWMLDAYDRFPVDAANVSARDLKFLARVLAKPEFAARQARQPILGRLVSANLTVESPDLVAPKKFIVREVPERQGSGKVRVAFVGLADADPAPPRGFKVTDPVAAAAAAVPEARRAADVVVVLAHLKAAEAEQVARAVQGIDAMIVGNGDIFTRPAVVGRTRLVFTPFETRTLGELRFHREPQGGFTSRARFISLAGDEKDPAALEMIAGQDQATHGGRKAAKDLLERWSGYVHMTAMRRQPQPAANGEAGPALLSASACAQCHLAQYMKWRNSDHARTTDSLVKNTYEFEVSCLNCHASGFRDSQPPTETQLPKFGNVQCEHCHGPGGDHVAKPAKGFGKVADIKGSCAACHTPETSPDFDFQAYWEKIKH